MLYRAIYNDDKKAQAYLHSRFYPKIRLHIISRIGSVADVDDLAQDVFVALGRSYGRYDGQTDPAGYLCGVANNIIRRYLRTKSHSPEKNRYELIVNIAAGSRRDDPSYSIQAEELKKTIEKALEKLPPKTRLAIRMRFIDGLSTKEAAGRLGCSTDAFYKLIYYGLGKIHREQDL